jgi:calreticulin
MTSVLLRCLFYFCVWLKQAWKSRWTTPSNWKPAGELGEWEHTAGKWYGDEADKGIQTSQDARFYGLSAKMDKPFTNTGKELVVQYSVKHENKLDCGGAYIKLMPGGDSFDAESFGGDTPYAIMFGPDICGASNKRTHVILNYEPKGENMLIKKDIPCETDAVSHLYTLVLRSDDTFEVFVDNKSVRSGKLEDAFDMLPAKEIKDPEVTKPEDWVDTKKIPDPEDVKPEGYDDMAEEIPDPDAKKPDDWDDEEDGEWEAPMVDNPEYKGPWRSSMIDK